MSAPNVDMTTLVPEQDVVGENDAETQALRQLALDARQFLLSFRWCQAVQSCLEGLSVVGVVGVYLMHIVPTRPGVDDWLWVIVGDVPPAYLVTDDAPTPAMALHKYIAEMRKWISAVRRGEDVDALIPLNVPPNHEYAAMLESRLSFLEQRVIPHLDSERGENAS